MRNAIQKVSAIFATAAVLCATGCKPPRLAGVDPETLSSIRATSCLNGYDASQGFPLIDGLKIAKVTGRVLRVSAERPADDGSGQLKISYSVLLNDTSTLVAHVTKSSADGAVVSLTPDVYPPSIREDEKLVVSCAAVSATPK